MEVLYDEGRANHIGPEPCAVVRKGGGEASAGERIGQPLSLENYILPGRAAGRPGVVKDTGMCGSSLYGNREMLPLATGAEPLWSASGRRGAVADEVRGQEVRLRRSSCEADEQGGAIRCGAGGAKGGGRGECGPAKHAPDAEPGKRVTGAGTHTASSKAKEERGEVHRAFSRQPRPSPQ